MRSKRQRGIDSLQNLQRALRCPHCQKAAQATDTGMTCENHHTFDVAKQGYLHLAGTVAKSRYTKELFTARQALLSETRFFNPLISEIATWIEGKSSLSSPLLVDMGCGEGTHLAGILEQVKDGRGIGIDLAKEGIQLATNHDVDALWLVADLAKSPVQEHSVDVILNILSPANHQEFRRILKPGGYVVKVIPNAQYLEELRKIFYAGTDKETYENEGAKEQFEKTLETVHVSRHNYSVELTGEQWRDLIAMTPLTWNAPPEQVDEFIELALPSVTVDLTILVGKLKKS